MLAHKAKVTREDMAYVLYRVQRAVRTLRRMPAAMRTGRLTTWPDFVREYWDAYGYSDPTPPRIVPTAKQISEMDEVLGWLVWLASEQGGTMPRVLWAKAEGYSYRRIGRLCTPPCSQTWARAQFHNGLWLVAHRYLKK